MLSIIIPTFNERENVNVVASAIRAALFGSVPYEIVFVDDSTDDTPQVLEQLTVLDPHVRYIHRYEERGLATAVIRGFHEARGDVLTVMDADLQHPPAMICQMIREIEAGSDIVIPSRFVPGGDDGGLRLHRKLVSAVARYIGKALLKKVRPINDPTSGYFAFRRSVIDGVMLKPVGWKILIEILVRGKYSKVAEIPYRFNNRHAGTSKMSVMEQWNYLKHIVLLIVTVPENRRFYVFSTVGLSGVLVNLICYTMMVRSGLFVSLSGMLSALVALVSNFILNDRITWYDVQKSNALSRAIRYLLTALGGITINVGLLSLLFYVFHVHYLLANVAGIAVATIWNYILSSRWTWGPQDHKSNKTNISLSITDMEGSV